MKGNILCYAFGRRVEEKIVKNLAFLLIDTFDDAVSPGFYCRRVCRHLLQ